MKRFTFLKAFMLSCFMAAVSLLPMSLNAQQTSDDFFRTNDFGGSRYVAEWSIVNNGIGQSETPLGSGLLVLTAVGAGYAIARRKRNIKKGTTLLLAALMLLGMTNCRKNLETINSVPSNGVYITLDLNGGSKVIVNPTGHTDPNYATVTWEDGDILYVGNNGAYCGYLEYDGTKFGGTINPTSGDDADYLHFYFMGNKGTTSEPTSVNITDQTSKYPVISYGRSTDLYNSAVTSYSATLYNKCAIRKFNTTEIDKAITITGMNNTVTVNFAANKGAATGEPYSFSKSGNGEIKLHAESNNKRWAILLPQPEVTTATAYAAGYSTTSTFTVPEVVANGYYDTPVGVFLTDVSPKGAFTINDSGDQVFFAPGNLQYQASTNTWRFAENQWDYVGSDNSNISSDYSGWIDLFGWGTSGYNHGAVAYQPWSTSTDSENDYNAYGNSSYNLYDQTGTADWGYSASDAMLGGYTNWRTLTGSEGEWKYIFENRKTTSGIRFAKARVNNINGIILLPDSWNSEYFTLSYTNETSANYTQNIISLDNWTNSLEAYGAVFLPAAGYRINSVGGVGSDGLYWTSTQNNPGYAYYVWIKSNGLTTGGNSLNRNYGFSVRLVRPL
ncbi:MAG: hypothetical protein J5708_03165 [Bacteroidales bacterium]|nr:hypothetical protein [Bacteroidales bacterium]